MFNEILPFYSKTLYVTLKIDDTTERCGHIEFNVEQHSSTNLKPRKELVVRLTESNDLFFYYTLKLTEEDFHSLKSQQGLLVDFASFPQKFIDLLELCHQEENKEHPKFLLIFNKRGPAKGTLEIIETNLFKHLTHLSLNFMQGSDIDVKKYLAECLQEFKERNVKMEAELKITRKDCLQKLNIKEEQLSYISNELNRIKIERSGEISANSAKLMQDLAAEREKHSERLNELQLKHQKEIQDLEIAREREIRHVEAKFLGLEACVKDLTEKKSILEANAKDLRGRLAASEDEVRSLRQEIQNCRHENTLLNATVHEREKMISSLKNKSTILEQDLKETQETATKQHTIIDNLQKQTEKERKVADHKQVLLNLRESKIKELSNDVIKANEIIKKMQADLRLGLGKAKTHSQIALQQEKAIEEKDNLIDKLQKDLRVTRENLVTVESELQQAKLQLDFANDKLEKYQQDLSKKENGYLNKQLNEKHILQQKGMDYARQKQLSRPMMMLTPPGLTASGSSAPNIQQHRFPAPSPVTPNPRLLSFYAPLPESHPGLNSGPINERLKKNKENESPLDPKYFNPRENDVQDLGNDQPEPMLDVDDVGSNRTKNTMNKKVQVKNPNGRIPKTAFMLTSNPQPKHHLLSVSSSYFPKQTTGTV